MMGKSVSSETSILLIKLKILNILKFQESTRRSSMIEQKISEEFFLATKLTEVLHSVNIKEFLQNRFQFQRIANKLKQI